MTAIHPAPYCTNLRRRADLNDLLGPGVREACIEKAFLFGLAMVQKDLTRERARLVGQTVRTSAGDIATVETVTVDRHGYMVATLKECAGQQLVDELESFTEAAQAREPMPAMTAGD